MIKLNQTRTSMRIVGLMLAVCILLSSCGPAPIKHAEISFPDIEYIRPDVPKTEEKIATAKTLAANGDKKSLTIYDDVLDDMRAIDTMMTIAVIRHDADTTETYYEGELTYLDDSNTRLTNLLNALTEEILTSKLASTARKTWGEPFIERYNSIKNTYSPKIEELKRRETDLINKYTRLLTSEYTTTAADGKVIKIDDLDFSLPIHDQYYDEIYYKRKNELGGIYVELCAIRVEIAEKLGFPSYTDLAYFNRGYTKEQSSAFAKQVKAEIVPLYSELTKKYQRKIWRANAKTDANITDTIEVMKEAFKAPEYPKSMAEALDYMLTHKAYNFDSGENMTQGAYSTLIYGLNMPYMFIEKSREYDPTTLIHEFGHYNDYFNYSEGNWNDLSSIDLAEINSQALELLMHDQYGKIFGEENAEIFRIANIISALENVISGCAEDEFQQRVFQNPGMTVNEINDLYVSISNEYHNNQKDFVWVEINHHFQAPFYYIGYATSAISALELWEISLESRQDAFAKYEKLCGKTKNTNYLSILSDLGLHSPFEEGSTKRLADTLRHKLLNPSDDDGSSETDNVIFIPSND